MIRNEVPVGNCKACCKLKRQVKRLKGLVPKRKPLTEEQRQLRRKRDKLHYHLNKEKYAARAKVRFQKTKAKRYAKGANRRNEFKLATPSWANLSVIEDFYDEARYKTKMTGIKHEVDHVIPLHGETVCGLHVENNLQVLTKTENVIKGNFFKGNEDD